MVSQSHYTGSHFNFAHNHGFNKFSYYRSVYRINIFIEFCEKAVFQLQVLSKVRVPTKLQVYFTNFFRAFSIGLILLAANVPSVTKTPN